MGLPYFFKRENYRLEQFKHKRKAIE